MEQRILGNWEFNSKEDNLIKTTKLKRYRFHIEFFENKKCSYSYLNGLCGNETPKMREGKWSLKDSVLTIQLIQFNEEKTVFFHIQEITEDYLILK